MHGYIPEPDEPAPMPAPDTLAALERVHAARLAYYRGSVATLARALGEQHATTQAALMSFALAKGSK